MKMLSELERKRLQNRQFLSSGVRGTNDTRVRKKLNKWLKDIPDVLLSLNSLAHDQLQRDLIDEHAYILLAVIESVLRVRDFRPIVGKIDDASNWKVPSTVKGEELPKDGDIYRSVMLHRHIEDLCIFYGQDNPISDYEMLVKMDADEKFRDRITDDERESIKRITEALKNTSGELLRKDDARVRELDRRLNPPDGTMDA